MIDWVLMDFETASDCDLKKSGAWRYAEDPTTEVLCLHYSTNGDASQGWVPGDTFPISLSPSLNPKRLFLAFNVAFEKAILRKIMVPYFDWPDILNSRWHDVQAACANKALPIDLETVLQVLGLEEQKDREGSALVKSLSRPNRKGYYDRSPTTLSRVGTYCGQDVRAEVGLHDRVGWLPPDERNVWLLDQRINERGVGIDLDYVRAAQAVVDKATVPLAGEFCTLTGGLKFTQRDKIMAWSSAEGVHLPDLTKGTLKALLGAGLDVDEEDDLDALTNEEAVEHIQLPTHVRRALEIRQLVGSAAVKKLPRMVACTCADGRARGLIQYHGAANSGRFAGRLIQPHNFPIVTPMLGGEAMDPELVVPAIMSGDPEYVEAMLGLPPVHGVISALRHAFLAAHGRRYVAADYSGVEARLLLAFCGQHDKAQLMASGVDVYADAASLIFGYLVNKKSHPFERDIGKHAVLGLGYGLGWKMFIVKYAKGKDEAFGRRVVDTYRKEWAPCVPEFWYALEEAALGTIVDGVAYEAFGLVFALEDKWLTIRLLSGRKLWFYNPRTTKRAMPWDPNDVRLGWCYNVMKNGQWKTVNAFGGLLTGIVIQASARDLLVSAMFKCEENNMPLAMTVHDENVTEPLIEHADTEALRQIMVDIDPWAKQIRAPIAVEVWEGDRYRK